MSDHVVLQLLHGLHRRPVQREQSLAAHHQADFLADHVQQCVDAVYLARI